MPSRQTNTSATSRSRASSNRAGAAARNEILSMLKDDHKEVKKLFRQFEKLDVHEDAEECEALVKQTCQALEMHATLEEEIFYPAARSCLGEEDVVDEAEVEHMSAKMLIEQLEGMTPDDEKYAATFKVLGEYIKHHVSEEENEMFPQLSHAKLDWQELQEEMNERRETLMDEMQSGSKKSGASAKSDSSSASREMQKNRGSEKDSGKSSDRSASRSSGEDLGEESINDTGLDEG